MERKELLKLKKSAEELDDREMLLQIEELLRGKTK